jgi:hypothetical protein
MSPCSISDERQAQKFYHSRVRLESASFQVLNSARFALRAYQLRVPPFLQVFYLHLLNRVGERARNLLAQTNRSAHSNSRFAEISLEVFRPAR